MAIVINDNFEVRRAAPIDTRNQVPNFSGLLALNPSYNYLGMTVQLLDTFQYYTLQSGTGQNAGDWTLREQKVQDDDSPTLGGNLDANGFNITGAGIVQGHRQSELLGAGLIISSANADKMLRFGISANAVVTVDDSSLTGLAVDTEVELFHQSGAFDVSVATGGAQTVISKDGNLTLDGIGSAAILKYVGNDTWILIGDLKT